MQSLARALTRWKRLPGNWDTLHLAETFPADNAYGIPTLERAEVIPARLVQWGSRPELLKASDEPGAAVHFFVDDYRFEGLWNQPGRSLDVLSRIGCVLTPDFSLWRDMPMVMQQWNVYRNRWIGCYWQARGLAVIPTVSWSHAYDFCYAGIPPGSVVAIASVGVKKDPEARRLFAAGYARMRELLRPQAILCYGSLDGLEVDDAGVTLFPTRWQDGRSAARRRAIIPAGQLRLLA